MKSRILYFMIGQIILTLGSSLIIKANLGAAPWEALAVGESQIFHLSVGTCAILNGIVLIFINSFIQKRKPEILSVLTIFLTGTLIDFWLLTILESISFNQLIIKILVLLAGIFILGFGVALYLQAKFPASPMDTIMIAIHEKFDLSLRNSKLIAESTALILAYLINGAVGIASIVIALTIGGFVQFFHQEIISWREAGTIKNVNFIRGIVIKGKSY